MEQQSLVATQYSAFFVGIFAGWIVFVLSMYLVIFINKKTDHKE